MRCNPLLLSALLLLACSEKGGGASGIDTSGPGDSGGSTHTGDTQAGDTHTGETGTPPSLHGTAPAEALPAPDFAATNFDGAARSRSDLLTHPTVMWFYPAANTAG